MTRFLSLLLFVFLLLPQSTLANPPVTSDKVLWIYDGDTIKVENIGKVRLLGIDTPEKEDSERDYFYLRQGVSQKRLRQMAQDALNYLIHTVKGKNVSIRYDHETHDRHGRTLAYVYLPDGQLLNQQLVEKGYAAVYRKFDFRLKNNFLAAERSAREKQLGLWQK